MFVIVVVVVETDLLQVGQVTVLCLIGGIFFGPGLLRFTNIIINMIIEEITDVITKVNTGSAHPHLNP